MEIGKLLRDSPVLEKMIEFGNIIDSSQLKLKGIHFYMVHTVFKFAQNVSFLLWLIYLQNIPKMERVDEVCENRFPILTIFSDFLMDEIFHPIPLSKLFII